jgi:ESF2/ABP1 family protein
MQGENSYKNYDSSFKWVHLSAYERAVHRQRMRTEVSQAKREAHHFQASVERSDRNRKFRKKMQLEEVVAEKGFEVPQRLLSSEHQAKKINRGEKEEDRGNLLQSFFGSK